MNLNCKQAIFIFILLSTLVTYSQDYSVKQSTEKFNSELWRIIAVSPDAYYTIDRKQSLKKFNSALELQKQVLFDPNINDQSRFIYKTLFIKEQLYLFYRYFDSEKKILEIKYSAYDKDLNVVMNNAVLTTFTCRNSAFMNSYTTHFSMNSSKIGFIRLIEKKLSIAIIGDDMAESAPIEYDLNFSPDQQDQYNALLSDEGNVYLIANEKIENVRVPNKHVLIFERNHDTHSVNLELDAGKRIYSCDLMLKDQQTLICSGFYCEDSTTLVKGVYTIVYNLKGREILSKTSFGINNPRYDDYKKRVEEAQNIVSEKERRKSLEKITESGVGLGYKMNTQIFSCEDGGSIMIGEEFDTKITSEYEPSSSSSGLGDMVSTYLYWKFDRIFILKFGPEGNMQWQHIIYRSKTVGPPITNLPDLNFTNLYQHLEKSGTFYFVYDERYGETNTTNLAMFNLSDGTFKETEIIASKITTKSLFNFPVKFKLKSDFNGFVFVSPVKGKETLSTISF